MDSSTDWVLHADDALVKNHVVDGKHILPGLAYLDLLLRMAQRRGLRHTDYFLDRLAIVQPLGIDAGEQAHLHTSFSKTKDGWHLSVAGVIRDAHGRTSAETIFAKADLRAEPIVLSRRIDIAGLQSSSHERLEMNQVYAMVAGGRLQHAGSIRAGGRIFVLPSGGLIELAVESQYANPDQESLCHPALVDGAAMASGGLRHRERRHEQEGLFVPLACDSFRLLRPLPMRCYALIELDSFRSVNDIRKLDMDFFDAQGEQVAALRGLTAKMVRAEVLDAGRRSDDAAIQFMLRGILARFLSKDAAQIEANVGFYEMGFKSADLLQLLAEIEVRLDTKLPPALLFEYPTLRELGEFLSKEAASVPRSALSAPKEVGSVAAIPPSVSATGAMQAQQREPTPLAQLPALIARLASKLERSPPVELHDIRLDECASADASTAGISIRDTAACPAPRKVIDLAAVRAQAAQAKLGLCLEAVEELCDGAALPVTIARLRLFKSPPAAAYLISKQRSCAPGYRSFDAFLVGSSGDVIAEAIDIVVPRNVAKRTEAVAIIGASGRYPRARNLDEFWRNLREGVDCIGEVPASRWDWTQHYGDTAAPAARHSSKWGGFIDGVDEFDAEFFGIPAEEAALLDPQERLFLQEAWSAMEDAGYTRESLARAGRRGADSTAPNDVSVYVGVMYGDYQLNALSAQSAPVSVHPGTIANRVSYCLNLNGPSMAVDALCASSLTSLHLACEDLRAGRANLAIAGGVNLTIHPSKYAHLSAAGLLSSASVCQSLGHGADGYIPSEGVGALLLKRLADAEADQDQILGVIRASVVNHGGKSGGFSIPNPRQQRAVIERALAVAQVNARDVSYVEAHATGTLLGDPIEVAALTQAFRKHTGDVGFCLLGSAKSNMGHAESAAGIAGVTKILLQLRHGLIAPSLHAEQANPHMDLSSSPFAVNRQLSQWRRPVRIDAGGKEYELPRIAGISSFGATGANAHLIIQEYLPLVTDGRPLPAQHAGRVLIVPLSARSDAALVEVAQRLRVHVEQWLAAVQASAPAAAARSHAYLMDIAFTLQVGREAMSVRKAIIAGSLESLCSQLHCLEHGGQHDSGGPGLNAAGSRELGEMAARWEKGESVHWELLYAEYGGYRPRRISLPTYPFARQRYWVGREHGESAVHSTAPADVTPAAALQRSADDPITAILRKVLARHLHCAPEEIAAQSSFFELGLGSVGLVKVSQEAEQLLHIPLSPTVLFEHDSFAALARHVAESLQAASLDGDVLAILEKLKGGALTPNQAHELIGER